MVDLITTQQGFLGGFIAACEHDDVELMSACLKDIIVEPQRSAAVPCFDVVKASAMTSGAIGCSLSGSGPSMFALCENDHAEKIALGMEQACREFGYDCQSWISPLDSAGARVEDSA